MFVGKLIGVGLVLVLLVWAVLGAVSELAVGKAEVVNVNTLSVAGETVRLWAIDAPKLEEPCKLRGRDWECGALSYSMLAIKVLNRTVWCLPKGRAAAGELLGLCYVGTREINKGMVAEGWALADRRYSQRYERRENEARRAQKGIWRPGVSHPLMLRDRPQATR